MIISERERLWCLRQWRSGEMGQWTVDGVGSGDVAWVVFGVRGGVCVIGYDCLAFIRVSFSLSYVGERLRVSVSFFPFLLRTAVARTVCRGERSEK